MGSAQGIRAGRAYVEIGADQAALARELRRAEARLRAFGASVQSVGLAFAKVGAAAAVPFAAAAKSFLDFESAMARVRAVTQASDADFKRLSDKAEELGRITEFSATAAANAFSNFAEAGLSVDEMLAAIKPTLNLASTGQIDVASAADIAAKSMRGLGLQAADLNKLVDVLAKAFITGGGPIEGVGDALKFVGPIARTAGTSFQELIAAIRLLSRAGIGGEMAGTTLRGAILGLTSPSAEAADELARLGVQVKDQKGNFRSLADIVGQLERALAGAGSASKLESLGKIFPARAAAGVATLVEGGGAALKQATADLADSTGTAGRVAAVRLDTLKGAVTILTSSIELLGTSVGAALNPELRALGDVLIGTVNGLAAMVKENRAVVVAVAKGVATVAGLGVGLVAAAQALKLVAVGFGVLRAAVTATTAVVLGIHAAFKLLTAAISLGSIVSALGASLAVLLTPAGLLTAAFLAGGAALIYFSGAGEAAVALLGSAFATLQADAEAAFGGIAAALKAGDIKGATTILWAFLKVEWLKGTQALSAIWSDWGGAIVAGFHEVSLDIAGRMVDAVAAIKTAWVGLGAFFGDLWDGISGAFHAAIDPLQKAFGQFFDWMAGEILKVEALLTGRLIDQKLKDDLNRLQREGAARNAGVDKAAADRQAAARARRLGRVGELGGIEAERAAARKAIEDQRGADAAKRRAAADDAVKRGADELAVAMAALKAAVDAAKPPPPEGPVGPPVAGRGPGRDLKKFPDLLPGAEAAQAAADSPIARFFADAADKLAGEKGAPGALRLGPAQKRAIEAANRRAFLRQRAGAGGEGGEGLTPEGLDLSLGQAERKISSRTTFSAAALNLQGFGDELSPLEREAKTQTKILTKIDDKLRNKAVFGA